MTRMELARLLREEIIAVLPHLEHGYIRDDQSLKDVGADSVERIEIILALKRRLFVDAPLAEFSTIPDIAALTEFLEKAKRS